MQTFLEYFETQEAQHRQLPDGAIRSYAETVPAEYVETLLQMIESGLQGNEEPVLEKIFMGWANPDLSALANCLRCR